MRERVDLISRFIVLLILPLSVFGCSQEITSERQPVVADGQFHAVRFARSSGPAQFTGPNATPAAGAARAATAASSGDFTFWAYTDQDASITVNRVLDDGTVQPYVTLRVPRGALYRRPDGTAFGLRDSILITVTPDPEELRVDLEPTGLVFNPLIPAPFTISYQGANGDFNGDGVVDQLDTYIEQVLLGLSTQVHPGDPWQLIPSINDIINQVLSSNLHHFTGYAVSW